MGGLVDLCSFLPTFENHYCCEKVGALNKTNSSSLKKPWLGDDPFLLGLGLFSGVRC